MGGRSWTGEPAVRGVRTGHRTRRGWTRIAAGVALVLSPGPLLAQSPTPAGVARAEEPAAPDGSFVRVTVRGGVSPFRMVAHDVTVRGDTVVVSLVKETLCSVGQRQDVRVVEGAGAAALIERLRRVGAFAKAPVEGAEAGALDARASTGLPEPRYEFWSAWGNRMERFHVDREVLMRHPDLVAVLTAVRDEVASRTDPLPMRDLYHSPSEMGVLVVTASEEATAVLDGWERFRLPMDGVDVVEGEHRLRVEGVSGRVREVTVRVERGMTSRYHVVLEDEAAP